MDEKYFDPTEVLMHRLALHLRSDTQVEIFTFIYDNPDCTLADIRRATGGNKEYTLHVIRDFRQRDLVRFREDEKKHVRHYLANYELVNGMVEYYRAKIRRAIGRD